MMAKLRGLHAFTSAAIALCAILVALFVCSPVSVQSFNMLAEDLYCGLDNCYVLLNVDRYDFPSKRALKKAYRKLSLELHPDRNNGDDTQFKKVANAYKILTDPKTKTEYDYYLDHPEVAMRAKAAGAKAVYKPPTPLWVVALLLVAAISAVQYGAAWASYNRKVERFRADPEIRSQAKKAVTEAKKSKKGAKKKGAGNNASNANGESDGLRKRGGDKKKGKKEPKKNAKELIEEYLDARIADDDYCARIGLGKPSITDVLGLWIVLKGPGALVSSVTYRSRRLLGIKRSEEEAVTDTLAFLKAVGKQNEASWALLKPDEKKFFLDFELWTDEGIRKFREADMKSDNNRYRRFLKWRKQRKLDGKDTSDDEVADWVVYENEKRAEAAADKEVDDDLMVADD